MGLREDLQTQRNNIDVKLSILNRVPEDSFPFGTIALFAPQDAPKYYFIKVDEEAWKKTTGGPTRPLNEFVLQAHETGIGYFEVYIMIPQETPIYASS